MRTMTDAEKSEIRCEVSIRLTYKDISEVHDRFSRLSECLKEKGLAPEISTGQGVYSSDCLILACKGAISLLDAEGIAAKSNVYVLPISVCYYPTGGFFLTKEELE